MKRNRLGIINISIAAKNTRINLNLTLIFPELIAIKTLPLPVTDGTVIPFLLRYISPIKTAILALSKS